MSLRLRPLFEKTSSTYTYLLADMQTLDAIIIDAVDETLVYPHDYIMMAER
jgi:sulfur dioxygenase